MNTTRFNIPDDVRASLNIGTDGYYNFGEDLFDSSWSSRPKIPYEGSLWLMFGMGMECHFCLVKKNGKIAIFFLDHTGMGGYGGTVVRATQDAFKYDEVVADSNSFINGGYNRLGVEIDYFGVRIGKKWGVVKLHDIFFINNSSDPYLQEVVPVCYNSVDEAFAQLEA